MVDGSFHPEANCGTEAIAATHHSRKRNRKKTISRAIEWKT
jgi:hypothetical protein